MKKLSLVFFIIAIVIISGCVDKKTLTQSGIIHVIDEDTYDWGDINIEGGNAEHVFELENTGTDGLVLKDIQTSCMCTRATVLSEQDEVLSPDFGMHGDDSNWTHTFESSQHFKVKVVFDPLAHGKDATGPIERTITIESSDSNHRFTTLSLSANVLSNEEFTKKQAAKDNENYSIQIGDFAFQKTEFDFGQLKQSQGLVSHEFSFRYTGETPLKVTGVPTSCQCTSAEISKQDLISNDTGIITVTFDPNLHKEPTGTFFKTISIITEPQTSVKPELKIWAEIEVDLGPERYKQQEHQD